MGMYDELIFRNIVDFGQDIPPILPNIVYQTKDFDCCLRTFDVVDNEIKTSSVYGAFQEDPANCDDVLSVTEMIFYCSSDPSDPILELSLATATEAEISKVLFFTNLFCHGWLEYHVAVCNRKIIRINAVYNEYGAQPAWERSRELGK